MEAGVVSESAEPDEEQLTKGLRRIQHMSSPTQIAALLPILSRSAYLPNEIRLDEQTDRLLLMLSFSLWGRNCGFTSTLEGVSPRPRACWPTM